MKFQIGFLHILSLTFIALYIFVIYSYAVNIPNDMDDVAMCLHDLNLYLDGQLNFFEYLLNKRLGHPSIQVRLLSYLSFKFIGTVNFKFIIYVSAIIYGLFIVFLASKEKGIIKTTIICSGLTILPNCFLTVACVTAQSSLSVILIYTQLHLLLTKKHKLVLAPIFALMLYSLSLIHI